MKANIPVIRYTSWPMVIPQLVTMLLFVGISMLLLWNPLQLFSVVLGLFAYLLVAYALRHFLTYDHRQGVVLVQRGDYQRAIPMFEKSLNFFSDHAWIDRLRAWTVQSPSGYTFREMALTNIAFCHLQLGDVEQAKAMYTRVLEEYPDNALAHSSLNVIATVEKSVQPPDQSG